MDPYQKYLDPQTLAKIKDLEIKARLLIEGLVSGAHKSPFQGVSVEFAEHREYTPGDDTRHIDWKVFGKTDKFYLKRYEQETNLVCNLVVDVSQSMNYASGPVSKHAAATQLAASIAFLVLHQQDSVGMSIFDEAIRHFVTASGQASQLKQLLYLLATTETSPAKSRIGPVLDELAERLRKRSVVVILSDCFDDLDAMISGLRHLRYKRHEVVLMHVLDGTEIDFPFKDATLFRGLEGLPQVLADPRSLRRAYQAEFQSFTRALQSACRSTNTDYLLVRTDQRLELVLSSYLADRLARSA